VERVDHELSDLTLGGRVGIGGHIGQSSRLLLAAQHGS
jgi:hypothetical protein